MEAQSNQQYETFFQSLRKCPEFRAPNQQTDTLIEQLSSFFKALEHVDWPTEQELPQAAPSPPPVIDTEQLALWFKQLEQPAREAWQSGRWCNPWEIAQVGTDEVRNSAILAWWLRPRDSHGLGDLFLQALMKLATQQELQEPLSANIQTECCPEGDNVNRLDIEIDHRDIYLVIEIKINAQEGNNQLQRYCELAQRRARHRPWKLIFLTRRGHLGQQASIAEFKNHVIPLSWKKLSRILGQILRSDTQEKPGRYSELSVLLAQKYLEHIAKF